MGGCEQPYSFSILQQQVIPFPSCGSRLFLFHRTLQRMLMAPCEIHHLCHLCFRYLMRKHTHHRQPLFVDGQHDVKRLCMGQAKEPLQHMHDKFHGRVIVIQQHDLVHRRPLRACLGLGQD
jgi:hypothetical protein